MTLSDILGIISVILGIVSIVISLVIYRISNNTSAKIFEDALERAFIRNSKQKNSQDEPTNNQIKETIDSAINKMGQKQRKDLTKKLKGIIRALKKKSSNTTLSIHAIDLAIQLKNIIDEEQLMVLFDGWKEKGNISWDGGLESSTLIKIIDEEGIYESINTR